MFAPLNRANNIYFTLFGDEIFVLFIEIKNISRNEDDDDDDDDGYLHLYRSILYIDG